MNKRITLALLAGAAALVLSACTAPPGGNDPAPSEAALSVGVAYDLFGRGDGGINDLAYEGIVHAGDELGLELNIQEVSGRPDETDADRADRLRLLVDSGFNPIVTVGFTYAAALSTVAQEHPEVSFAIVDDASLDLPNVAGLTFAEHEGSFLVGAAAALSSEAGHVGFVGGVDVPLIHKFQAGYEAGVAFIDPSIVVDVTYLSQPPDFSGFGDPARGREAATGMFDSGADIVYAAAGGSGTGVFEAALASGNRAIGVDFDQYLTAAEELRPVIMTSMLKNVNVGTQAFLEAFVAGTPMSGNHEFTVKEGGVGYAVSGGQIDGLVEQLDGIAAQIASGEITVPRS